MLTFSQSQYGGLFLWDAVWAVGGCGDSAVWLCLSRAQRLCEREENILRLEVGGCKSEQHLLPRLRRVVWGQQRQISHRSYLLHSSQRQFVLAADRTRERERGRIGFLFERWGMLLAWAVSLLFSLLRVYRGRSVTDLGSKALIETATTAEWYSNYSCGKFLDVIT